VFKILSVSRNTRRLIERNDILALSGFRVVSPRTPEEAPFLAVQQNVDAVVIGHSVEGARRTAIVEAIRRLCPECMIVFVYRRPNDADEPLADVSVDVTDGPELLVNELRTRLPLVHKTSAPLLQQFLQAAIKASGADFGNIQLFDSATRTLRIAAQHGFSGEFLRFFKVVYGTDTSCGSAADTRSRVIVEDVCSDAIFAGNESGEMVLRANVRAVQSTPLIGESGQLLGVLSTHYRKPGVPSAAMLVELDRVTQDHVTQMERKPAQQFQQDMPFRRRA
jgi:hypothetical protein